MNQLELALPSLEENLAVDEALLSEADASASSVDVLRVWEPREYAVVLGRNSREEVEVNTKFCRTHGITIRRRASGGCAVVIGPGCLMYSLVLSCRARERLRTINSTHQFVLDALVRAWSPLAPGIERAGVSDLAIRGRKVAGNSLRCARHFVLYHGTLLYSMDLALVERCLHFPPHQPEYRASRPHSDFIANVSADRKALIAALVSAWQAYDVTHEWPVEETRRLVRNYAGSA